MKITKKQLKRIIKEEIGALAEDGKTLKQVGREKRKKAGMPPHPRYSEPDDNVEMIGSLIHTNGFLNARESLGQVGFKVDFVTNPLPMYILEKDGVKYVALNKEYAEQPDLVVGNIAIGVMS